MMNKLYGFIKLFISAIVIALLLKTYIISTSYAATNNLTPKFTKNSFMLVWKFKNNYQLNDYIIFRKGDKDYAAIITNIDKDNILVKNNISETSINQAQIIGKIIY